jgi:hypothetical protein
MIVLPLLFSGALFFGANPPAQPPKTQNVPVLKYAGVSPPKPELPKEIPPAGGKCVLLWPGFQLKPAPGGSRFFFLFSSPFQLQSQELTEGKTKILRLMAPACSAWQKHAWRDLITRFFQTPIEKVSFFRDDKNTKLIVDFLYKNGTHTPKPEISHITFQNYYLLMLDFPPEKDESVKTLPTPAK